MDNFCLYNIDKSNNSIKIFYFYGIYSFIWHIILSRGLIWEKIRKTRIPSKKARTLKIVSKIPFKSDFDNLGSYTGVDAEDIFDIPVQDADDL